VDDSHALVVEDLEDHRLWLLTLPLSLAGAIAVYAMLTAGAEE
jgi:hypothetical protein